MQPNEANLQAEAMEQHEETGLAEYAAAVKMDEPKAAPLDAILDETVAREKAKLAVREGEFAFQQRRAKMFAKSGLFYIKGVEDPDIAVAQAMVRIELGESLGFAPAESMMYIDIISGRPAIAAAARAARMQLAGYSWTIQWAKGRDGQCEGCTIYPRYKGKPILDEDGSPAAVSFLKSDALALLTTMWDDKAKQKKRVSVLEKENWKMTPKNMYFARAISNAQRFYAPGVLNPSLLSFEEAWDIDEEAASKPKRERATVSIDDLKPGTAANAGHDATGAEAFTLTEEEMKATTAAADAKAARR